MSTETLDAATVLSAETWDNKDGPGYQPGPNPPLALTERQAAMQATRTCSIEGCTRNARERGMCHTCYVRLLNRGEIQPLNLSLADRLAAGLVLAANGCLEWTKGTDTHGYGSIGVAGNQSDRTHRVAWILANGPIPDGLSVLHHCDNPPCAQTNPTKGYPEGHLFLGTKADNNADMFAKGRDRNGQADKTHCPKGHPYDEVNTYVDPRGYRECRTCKAMRDRQRKRRTS